jgi:hypothetical protein
MLAHVLGDFGPWLTGFIFSGPAVRQNIMAKGVVEQNCSPHGSWESERRASLC